MSESDYDRMVEPDSPEIAELKRELEIAEKKKIEMIMDRDQAFEDLRNVESAFSDVQRKHERAKVVVNGLKKKEDVLKRHVEDLAQNIHATDGKLEQLKEEALNTLEFFHRDYESKMQIAEAENLKLRATLRKTEMKNGTLARDLEQKTKENVQLNALCDDIINGAGGTS